MKTIVSLALAILSFSLFAQESLHRQCIDRVDYTISETLVIKIAPQDSICLEKAILYFSKIKHPSIKQRIYYIVGLFSRASTHISQNRMTLAIKDMDEADTVVDKLKASEEVAPDTIKAFINSLRSSFFYHQSDFQKTIEYSDKAISIFKKYQLYGKVANEYLNKYNAVRIAGDRIAIQECLDSADVYLAKENSILQKIRKVNVRIENDIYAAADTLLDEGFSAGIGIKEAQNTIQKLNSALINLKNCSLASAMTYTQLAVQYTVISRVSKDSNEIKKSADNSLYFAQKSLSCIDSAGLNNTIYASNIYAVSSLSFQGKQKYYEALWYVQRSLEILGQPRSSQPLYEMVKIDLSKINSKYLYAQSLIVKAGILSIMHQKLGDFKYLHHANLHMQSAVMLVDNILMGLVSDSYMGIILEQASTIYMGASVSAWRLAQFKLLNGKDLPFQLQNISSYTSDLESSFHFAEQSKSFTLRRKLTIGEGETIYNEKNTEGVQSKLYSIEKKYRNQISNAENKVKSQPNWNDSLNIIRNNYSQFIQKLSQSTENSDSITYYNGRFGKIPTIQDIQNKLPDSETAILEYVMNPDEPFVFIITKSKVTTKILPSLWKWKSVLNQHITSKKDWLNGNTDYLNGAYTLYKILVKSIVEDSTLGKIKNLVIVNDGQLREIVFETLLTEPFKKGEPIPFLIRRYAISYQFALSLGKEKKNRWEGKNLLGVFVSQPNELSICGKDTLFELEKQGYKQVAKWKDQSQLFPNATVTTFIQEANNYRFIQLILHGCVEGRPSPIKYGLQFSDSELTILDIYKMQNVKPEMLILSNCQSGNGPLSRGEGIISLAWAFTSCGASSVIASVNDIRDPSSSKILEGFYKYLDEGKSKDKALQLSKIDFLSERQHPQYWASIICIGDTSPIK